MPRSATLSVAISAANEAFRPKVLTYIVSPSHMSNDVSGNKL